MADLFTETYNPDVLSCLANLSNDEVFTPPEVANQVLDMLPDEIWEDPDATFLDPACKSGIFLREIAKRLIAGLEDKIPDLDKRLEHIYKRQLFGIAPTELCSLLSRRSLYCSKYPNSKYSVVRFDTAEGNVRYRRTHHTWKNGRCVWCGAAKVNYDRDESLEQHAYEFIHPTNLEEIKDMKFDVIVGNPPYQLSDGGAQASASPIYQLFVENAIKLNPKYIAMIIPARWYSGGKGLGTFRNDMLASMQLAELHDYPITSDCFPGVSIRGGICYFLWDRDKNSSQVDVYTHQNGSVEVNTRELDYDSTGIFIRYYEALSILNKVKLNPSFVSMESWVSPRRPFGLDTSFVNSQHFSNHEWSNHNCIKCYGRGKRVGYIAQEQVESHKEWIPLWKVFAPRANNIGTELSDDNMNAFVGAPGSVCTESYVVIGAGCITSEEQANSLANYLKTKFVRFLHSLAKVSQDATAKTYRFVPIPSSLDDCLDDEALFDFYGLSDSERAFIIDTIKEMV